MTSPYLEIPLRTYAEALADATANAVKALRAKIKAHTEINRAA